MVKKPALARSPSKTATFAPGASDSGPAFHAISVGMYSAQVPTAAFFCSAARLVPSADRLATPDDTKATTAATLFMATPLSLATDLLLFPPLVFLNGRYATSTCHGGHHHPGLGIQGSGNRDRRSRRWHRRTHTTRQ